MIMMIITQFTFKGLQVNFSERVWIQIYGKFDLLDAKFLLRRSLNPQEMIFGVFQEKSGFFMQTPTVLGEV